MSNAIVAYLVGTAGLLALIVFPSGWVPAFSVNHGVVRPASQALLIEPADPTASVGVYTVFLAGWGFAFAAAMTAFTLVGCWFVERTCLRLYGPAYREFQSTTPLLLPRLSILWHRRRLSRGLVR